MASSVDSKAAAPAHAAHRPHSHHRDVQGGAARAAVFGMSDGLLTNVSLILGVAGAAPQSTFVRLAGLAGLVAGAFSMAAGEYVSMSAQKELLERELAVEQREIERHPEAETRELAATFRGRGLSDDDAQRLATAVMQDPEIALDVHAREELGVRPGQTGNPWQAAVSSFVSFAIGAMIPLIPWFFATGHPAVIASILLGAASAIAIGWGVALFTGRSRVRSAARQLVIATVAAGVTYGIGTLVGVHAS
jgi:VIT1/CCC1 family predicted Fe2+/Mn2+ transporter